MQQMILFDAVGANSPFYALFSGRKMSFLCLAEFWAVLPNSVDMPNPIVRRKTIHNIDIQPSLHKKKNASARAYDLHLCVITQHSRRETHFYALSEIASKIVYFYTGAGKCTLESSSSYTAGPSTLQSHVLVHCNARVSNYIFRYTMHEKRNLKKIDSCAGNLILGIRETKNTILGTTSGE